MHDRPFIKYDSILNEFKYYELETDFECMFENLDYDIKENLEFLTQYYYSVLEYSRITNTISLIIKLQSAKDINGIPVNITIYFIRNTNVHTSGRIGLNVILQNNKDYLTDDYYLQNISIDDCNFDSEDDTKNYIYNVLFYAHIVINYFKFNPLLKYIYPEEDVNNLIKLQKAHIKLFGKYNECCVCTDETVTCTKCRHYICQKCYIKLERKICPMCRKNLYTGSDTIILSAIADFLT